MNFKLLVKTVLTIALFLIVTGCGDVEPAPQAVQAVCLVPDIVGVDLSAAESPLIAAKLQPVKDFRHDESVAKNAIISQEPAAGTRLEPCQGDVVIVISLGPVPLPTETPRPTDTPSPTETPTDTPSPTESPAPPTPLPTPSLVRPTMTPSHTPTLEPMYGNIPFADPNHSTKLASWWQWHPGGSNASSYSLNDNAHTLTLTVGPGTDQWSDNDSAPYISYKASGDFEAEVELSLVASSNWAVGGLGIMSSQETKNWLRIVYALDNKIYFLRNGNHIVQEPYPNNNLHLKIKRKDTLIHTYYSATGDNWEPVKENYVYDLPETVFIYLLGFTQENEGDVIIFHEFKVTAL